MAKRLSVFLVGGLWALLTVESAFAQAVNEAKVRVEFAVLLDHDDPVAGTAICTIGRRCVLVEQQQPEIALDLTLVREADGLTGEIVVRCGWDCSFSNGQSMMRFRSERAFDFFKGRDGLQIPLVLRPRETIGRIMLAFP